jgi:hypothetical protein
MKNIKIISLNGITVLALASSFFAISANAQATLKIDPFPLEEIKIEEIKIDPLPAANTNTGPVTGPVVYKNLQGRDLYEEIRRQTGQEPAPQEPEIQETEKQEIQKNIPIQSAPQSAPPQQNIPVPWYKPVPEQDRLNDEKAAFVPARPTAAPPSIVSKPALSSPQWSARRGQDLKEVLSQWSRTASVDLLWQNKTSFSLPGDFNITGAFEDAVASLLAQYSSADSRPIGTLYGSNEGKRVLLIQSQSAH